MLPHVTRSSAIAAVLPLILGAPGALAQRSVDPTRPVRPASAQVAVPAPPALDLGQAGCRIARDVLHLSNQADGSPQVRARAYKAEFTPEGATYIPFCGSEAPASHPLAFQLESITAGGVPVEFAGSVVAGLEGSTVRYARGGVTEVYELALDSLEQKFVFDSLPASGALVVRLAVATGMSASREGSALFFASDDGTVRYGAATVVDASGARTPAATELDGQGIVIRVPASFLAQAVFPVTIDPVISTFYVGWTLEPVASLAPAIAWDEMNQVYCVAYEEVFSATDHDVVRVFVNSAGATVQASYVDSALSDYWAHPDVANNYYAHNFFVVAEVGLPSSGARTVQGRTLDASSAAMGAGLLVSTADQIGEKINPSVGGDPFNSASSYYTVVWQRVLWLDVDESIHGRQVTSAGALQGAGTILIDNSNNVKRHPRISKSCQGPGYHHVAWEFWAGFTDRDIAAAELSWNGNILLGPTTLVTIGDTTLPACSSINNAGQWMLVFERDWTTDHDIHGALVTWLTPTTPTDLTFREFYLGTTDYLEDQIHPSVETDGVHFVYSCAEHNGASPVNYNVYASTVDVINGDLRVGECHKVLGNGSWREDFPRVCSRQSTGGSGNQMAIAWQYAGVGIADIFAGIYAPGDFTKLCFPGHDGVMLCPCTGSATPGGKGCENSSLTGGASLDGSGNASLASDTAVLTTSGEKPTATSMLTQGSGLIVAGAPFGEGVRCAGGTLKRLYLKTAVAGSITAPVGADPSLHARSAALGDPLSPGSTRYYYVYYRDATPLGGCGPALGYNATDTVQVIWRP